MGNIGTGSFLSGYRRPEFTPMSKEKVEKYLARPNTKKLEDGMYELGRLKWGRSAYSTILLIKRADGWYETSLPTDKDGIIKDTIMVERLLDVESGDREGHVRNVMVDIGIDAAQHSTPKELANSYRWYINPNESDVDKIDDSKSKIVTVLGKSEMQGTPSRLVITGGTVEQRDAIANDIRNNFTGTERLYIRHCLIQIVPVARGWAGMFQGHADANGKPIGVPKILIESHYVPHSDVIIHETIHALREFDPKRTYNLRAVKRYFGDDADLEESLTEAETVTRQNPFEKQNSTAGYYHQIKIPNKFARDMVIEDRVVLTDSSNAGIDKTITADYVRISNDIRADWMNWDNFKLPKGISEKEENHIMVLETHRRTDDAILSGFKNLKEAKEYAESMKDDDEYYTAKGFKVNKDTLKLAIEHKEMAKEGKDWFTSGVRGKRALKALELRYPMTNISKLKFAGKVEAIDTYYKIDNRRGEPNESVGAKTYLHFYNPNATQETVSATDNALIRETSADGVPNKISRFDDGRAIPISKLPRHLKTTPRRHNHSRDLGAGIVESRTKHGRRRHVKLN